MCLRKIEEQHDSSESDSDDAGGDGDTEDDDELDVSQPKEFGSRKSQRQRTQAAAFGYQLDSSAIALTEDSEH